MSDLRIHGGPGFFAVWGRGRFFSLYPWGAGPHLLALNCKGPSDRRQVINAYTGMVDQFFLV